VAPINSMFNELTKQFRYLLSFLIAPGKVVFTRHHHTQHNDIWHSVIMLNVTYKLSMLNVVKKCRSVPLAKL